MAMPKPPSDILDVGHAGLLIAAHGSPNTAGGRTSSRKHAQTIATLNMFSDVQAAFLSEKPFVKDVLDAMSTTEVYVVPNLACAGYISTTKLPHALNLTGTVTERITPHGHQRVILTDPVGTDPALAKTIAVRIKAAQESLSLPPDDTAIVLVGHGSQRSRESFEHTNRIAADLARQNLGAPVVTTFLEEEPFIKDWHMLVNATHVVFAPLLISDGYHGADEIPRAIGFESKSKTFIEKLDAIQPNEITSEGRHLIYLPPIGDTPEMAELILSRVRAAQIAAA